MIRRWRPLHWGAAVSLILALALVPRTFAHHSQVDLVSTGPNPGTPASDAAFVGASQDGGHVFFQTRQSLVSGDSDSYIDIYDRTAAGTTLLSTAPATGNGPYNAYFKGASADGTRVFFETKEQLLSADHENFKDIYERSSGTTKLVSTAGVGANGPFDAEFAGASQDGTRVFFETSEPLAGGDTDAFQDVYQRSGSATTLISTGPSTPATASDNFFEGASADGVHVFFSTEEQLIGSDNDDARDIYDRFGGTTTLVSTAPGAGTADITAFFNGLSQDGSRVFFQTRQALTNGDTDNSSDVYERSGGSTTLVSTGSAGGNGDIDAYFKDASDDGTHVFFETLEQLTSGDTDAYNDIYDRSGGATTLVSTGPDGGNGDLDAYFQAASQDGTHVFFDTAEQLTVIDADNSIDLYERTGGQTKWVSTGPAGGHAEEDVAFAGISQDAARVFFSTREALVASDTDSSRDLYERSRGITSLISTGFGGGPSDAFFEATTPDGSAVYMETYDGLSSSDTDGFADVYVLTERPYTFPIGASPMRVSFVPAFQPCTAGIAGGTHNAPLSGASCNPPAPSSTLVAVGSRSLAFVRLKVLGAQECAPFNPSACSPDFTISASATDVRSGSPSGPDYDPPDPAGRDLTIGARFPDGAVGDVFQITDKYNQRDGDGQGLFDKSATGTQLRIPISLNCTPTVDPTIGSTCTAQTTANTLMPGAAVKGNRAVWETGQLGLFDRGADGVVGDSDDKLFEVQGVFVP